MHALLAGTGPSVVEECANAHSHARPGTDQSATRMGRLTRLHASWTWRLADNNVTWLLHLVLKNLCAAPQATGQVDSPACPASVRERGRGALPVTKGLASAFANLAGSAMSAQSVLGDPIPGVSANRCAIK